jgi:nucleosome binding factor SPN SPT16 subunit
MVLVLKDFSKAPVHVNTIPVEALEGVKDWLDSVNIPFTEGPLNLNWSTIMKTVTADPHQFFVDGGWSFLAADSDSEGQTEEEEESAFEMSDEELADMSEESSEDDSEFDDDASAEASDDASAVSDESGEDWDELEKKATKKDRESGLDDEDRSKKRKR